MADLYERSLQLAKSGSIDDAWNLLALNPMSLGLRELHLMLDIALLSKVAEKQEKVLLLLIGKQANNYQWSNQLATLYFNQQQFDSAVNVLQRYVANTSTYAPAWFNLAYMRKFTGEHLLAISAYEKALAYNITQPEEVYCNLGNIYSQELLDAEEAKSCYLKALAENADYLPAKFNLAGLLERSGNLSEAREAFIQCAEDKYYRLKCFTRALELTSDAQNAMHMASKIETLLSAPDDSYEPIDVVDAYFSLGRFYESVARYEESWACYNRANNLDSAQRNSDDIRLSLLQCAAIKHNFDANLQVPSNDTELVFICGLYRSGSTLLETMLSTHPNLMSGGEVDVFRKTLFAPNDCFRTPLPLNNNNSLKHIAEYLERISHQIKAPAESMNEQGVKSAPIGGAQIRLLDKQPENFLLLGYIKQLFPKAKFIWTCREKRNSIFSIYTQHFGFYQPYACDINNISAFYDQHLDLLAFWQQFFAEDIKVVNYEDLIDNTDKIMHDLQSFLNVKPDLSYENFHKTSHLVSTASMAQVRKPLHKKSLNRAGFYQKWLTN